VWLVLSTFISRMVLQPADFSQRVKSAYSSARSPLRGTMPARLRMTSEPPSLPESLDEAEYHLHYRTNINLAQFRCGRGDIKDLAFGVLCLRELSEAELRACLTHGRGELRRSREYSAKNGVKNL